MMTTSFVQVPEVCVDEEVNKAFLKIGKSGRDYNVHEQARDRTPFRQPRWDLHLKSVLMQTFKQGPGLRCF